MFRSLDKGNSFPVFEKLGINQWKDISLYKIDTVSEEDDGYVAVTLFKV